MKGKAVTKNTLNSAANPKISIIIPTYNRAKLLERAIESALAQDYQNFEVVVTDNASTDLTRDVTYKYSSDKRFCSYHNHENIGMVNNWKLALEERINGEWFLILSDDDYFIDKQYLSKAMELSRHNKNLAIIHAGGYISLAYEKSDLKNYIPLDLPYETISKGYEIFTSSAHGLPQRFILCNVLFKRDLAMTVNPFCNPFNLSCDTELFLRLCLIGDVGVIKDRVSVYTVHQTNLIKSVTSDVRLIIGNLDAWITPYKYAINLLTRSDLKIFLNNTNLVRMIHGAITRVLLDHPHAYPELQIRLKEIKDIVLGSILRGWRTKILIIFCLYAPNLVRAFRKIKRKLEKV
jgi:glycosyltransferase involved in cell wall biosynthesis